LSGNRTPFRQLCVQTDHKTLGRFEADAQVLAHLVELIEGIGVVSLYVSFRLVNGVRRSEHRDAFTLLG